MPIYTYRCENCGVQFERQQKFDELPLSWCPECNKKALRKVYLPVGIVFKGKGFYSTDHRSPSGQQSSRSSKSSEGEGKSESAPAETAKTETKPASTESSSKD
jgi:putative FmdB family regulatory protein